MKNHLNTLGRLIAVAGAALAISHTAQAADPAIRVPTLETLAQFPGMTGFRISPDGKHMLAIQSQGDTRTILVWKLAELAAKPTVIGASNMQIRSASFLKNDMLQVEMTQPYDLRADEVTKTFINKLLFTDLEGKNWIEPMASADIARSEIAKKAAALANPTVLNRLLSDPDNVILESDTRGDSRDIYRYNLRTAKAARIMRLSDSDARPQAGRGRRPGRGRGRRRGPLAARDRRGGRGRDGPPRRPARRLRAAAAGGIADGAVAFRAERARLRPPRLPGPRRVFRELPGLVLAAAPLPGVTARRVRLPDAAVRRAAGHGPAGRAAGRRLHRRQRAGAGGHRRRQRPRARGAMPRGPSALQRLLRRLEGNLGAAIPLGQQAPQAFQRALERGDLGGAGEGDRLHRRGFVDLVQS
ncbi:hypothetical protein OSTOST_06468 [Ostertagia ostertagi]